jgi:hypothetical protein
MILSATTHGEFPSGHLSAILSDMPVRGNLMFRSLDPLIR